MTEGLAKSASTDQGFDQWISGSESQSLTPPRLKPAHPLPKKIEQRNSRWYPPGVDFGRTSKAGLATLTSGIFIGGLILLTAGGRLDAQQSLPPKPSADSPQHKGQIAQS